MGVRRKQTLHLNLILKDHNLIAFLNMKPLAQAPAHHLADKDLPAPLPGKESFGRTEGWLHKLAIGFAGVCGVHCLLTPVLLILFPIIGSTFFVEESFHLWMLLAVVPTTVIAVFLGCRRHKDKYVFLLALTGLSLIIAAAVWGHGHELHSVLLDGEAVVCEHEHHGDHDHSHHHERGHAHSAWATWFTVIGAVFMVGGHFRNHRLCRSAHCCHGHDH